MPVNARSLPEFNVHPSDVMFSYKKKEYFLISNAAELGTLHLLDLCAYNTSNLSLKRCIFTLKNDHCNRKYTLKAVPFTSIFEVIRSFCHHLMGNSPIDFLGKGPDAFSLP